MEDPKVLHLFTLRTSRISIVEDIIDVDVGC
jgi:hypothetical protein